MANRPQLGYRPALDGIRALAIAAVVCLHTFGVPRQGAFGVDLFFVLSGFLITALLLEERRANGAISLTSFYRRRALRLLPGLFTLLLSYLAVTTVVLAARGELRSAHSREALLAVAAAFLYNSNLLQLAHHVPLSLSHLWSLAEEEQFYLVWPALLIILGRLRPSAFSRIVGTAILVIVLERLVLMLTGAGYLTLYLRPDTHAEPLLVGCLFGAWYVYGRLPTLLSKRAMRQWTSLIAVMLVLVGVFELGRFLPAVIYGTPILTAFAVVAAVLIATVVAGDTLVAQLLSTPPMTFLGKISYSLYLWHLPILIAFGLTPGHNGLRAVAAVATAVTVASASYYLVERPFLRLKYRHKESTEKSLAPVALTS